MNVADMIDGGMREFLAPRRSKEFYQTLSKDSSCARMNLNENLLVDSAFSNTLLQEAAKRIDARRYPAVKGGAALKAISEYLGLWEDQILVGNGSDEIIDLVSKVFVGGGEALVVDPTFEMYRFYVELSRGRTRSVLLSEGFEIKASDVLRAVSDRTKAIFICSPNNPTGKQHSKDEVLRVVEESERLVVLDEAYVDFAPYSLVREASKYDNLIVLRTFSKAFGLAGLRIGFAIANDDIIDWLRAAQGPFNVNAMAQEVSRLVLENRKIYDSFVRRVIEERKYLMAELQMINGVTPFESDANFLLIRVVGEEGRSGEVCRRLGEAGIEVRDRGGLPLLSNCLRATVSDRDSNLRFVKELNSILRSD